MIIESIIGLFLLFVPTSGTAQLSAIVQEPNIQTNQDRVLSSISKEQLAYLKKLSDCESSGSTTIRIIDTNNKYSYGYLQFQMATFLSQSKLYKLDYAEDDIFDFRKQLKLAHLMLLNGGEGHWFVCSFKIGKYPK